MDLILAESVLTIYACLPSTIAGVVCFGLCQNPLRLFVVSIFVVEENTVVVDPRNLHLKFAKILGAKK